MSAEEIKAIARAPLPKINIVGSQKTWGGAVLQEWQMGRPGGFRGKSPVRDVEYGEEAGR